MFVAGIVILFVLLRQGVAPLASLDAVTRAHPTVEGTIKVKGITAATTLRRDARGAPHITARKASDAWFGLGLAHAQDRLGQMLWLRRLARGTSAEVTGRDALPVDRIMRTIGIGHHADAEAKNLTAENSKALFAYVAGINARFARLDASTIRALQGASSSALEEPPWSPADSIAVLKLLSWSMGPSLESGVVFQDLVEALGSVGARPLMPTGVGMKGIGLAFELPGKKPQPKLRKGVTSPVASDMSRARAQLAATVLRLGAWVIAADASQSGAPLLAAEFHLSPTAPGLLYEAQISARKGEESLDVIGVTVPGVPVFWTGRNADVAWALTPGRVNTTQLYEETLRENGDVREFQSGSRWAPLDLRTEVIRVRRLGGEVAEEELVVESTGHGPLINGLVGGERLPIALDWLGAGRGEGMRSLMRLVHAIDASQLVEILADHREPVLVVTYADRAGAAGWQLAGWIPRRLLGAANLPTPGRQKGFNWEDRLRYTSLPSRPTLEEGDRFLIAADNPLMEGSSGRLIEWNWRTGSRSKRIERALSRLTSQGPISLRELAEAQTRLTLQLSPRVTQALESLIAQGTPLSPEASEVWESLLKWDGRFAPDRRGAALYHVFIQDLTRKFLESKIPRDLVNRYLDLAWVEPRMLIEGALVEAATKGRAGGWSDPALLVPLLGASLHQAWVTLSYQRGPNRALWSWGGLHRLSFRSFVGFDAHGDDVLWRFGGERPYPGQGGGVGMADYDPARPFDVRSASLYRVAMDLAKEDRMLTSLAPGQSEHSNLSHYRDGLRPWFSGDPRLFPRSAFLVEEGTISILKLEPGG